MIQMPIFEWLSFIPRDVLNRYINHWIYNDPHKLSYTFFRKVSQLSEYKFWFRNAVRLWLQKSIMIEIDISELGFIMDYEMNYDLYDAIIRLYKIYNRKHRIAHYLPELLNHNLFGIIFINELFSVKDIYQPSISSGSNQDFNLQMYEDIIGITENSCQKVDFDRVIFFAQHGIHFPNNFPQHECQNISSRQLSLLRQYGYTHV